MMPFVEHRARVLALLQSRGDVGATTSEVSDPFVGGHEGPRRVRELREMGYPVHAAAIGNGYWRYWLGAAPQNPQPSLFEDEFPISVIEPSDAGRFTGLRLHGMPVRLSEFMLEEETVSVPRTWRERFFTRPWQPWTATRTEVRRVPMRDGVRVGNTIMMHPATWATLTALTASK